MSEERERTPGDDAKERIFRSVAALPERRIKIGCWISAVVGLFVALLLINGLFFWQVSRVGTLLLAAGEFVILLFTFTVFGLIPRVLGLLVGRVGFLYHSGTHQQVIKPEVHRARALANRRDWAGAIKEYRRLLFRFPGRIDFLFEIAEIYRKEIGDTERALSAYRKVAGYPESGEFAYLVRQAARRIEELEGRVPPPPDVIDLE
jgi:tetratricopeptide (TPR) repeat protein